MLRTRLTLDARRRRCIGRRFASTVAKPSTLPSTRGDWYCDGVEPRDVTDVRFNVVTKKVVIDCHNTNTAERAVSILPNQVEYVTLSETYLNVVFLE